MSESPILEYWPEGTAAARIPANNNVRLIQALLLNPAISATTAAQPGSPAEGDVYILPASPTGSNWAGFFEGDLVIYYNATWTAYTPPEGLRKFVEDEGEDWQFVGDSSGGWAPAGGGGGGGVTSVDVSGGTTGLTTSGGPVTGSGTITLSGTLALGNGGTGAALTDPNADRLLFWDDSATAVTWLTLGSNLSITGTTLNATGGGGSGDVVGPASAVNNVVAVFDGTTGKLIKQGGGVLGTAAFTAATDYQPLDADLTAIAGLTATTDNFLQAKSSAWASRTVAQVSVDLQGTGLIADAVGFRTIPQNSKSAAYTLVAADSAKHILHPSADTTARIFTIPANASVAYPVGTALTFVNQNGAGTITIAITTDTMRLAGAGTTGSRTLAANGIATALKLTSTEWIISGTGLT